MYDLEQTIKERHSTRKFLSSPVPRELIDESLALAQCAPSNSNIQPWRLWLVSGSARDQLREALYEVAQRETPNVPKLPETFQHFRQELGVEVYGSMGIARGDKEGRKAAVLRNYEFFGAPVGAIICLHKDLGPADSLSVGMYLQTLVLALTARGLGTCVEVSLAGYPEVIHEALGIPLELSILCGLAIGYSDPAFPTNHLHTSREPVNHNVIFVEQLISATK
jgi:nitroreductase